MRWTQIQREGLVQLFQIVELDGAVILWKKRQKRKTMAAKVDCKIFCDPNASDRPNFNLIFKSHKTQLPQRPSSPKIMKILGSQWF